MVNQALHAEGVSFHEPIDTPLVTLQLFLSQVIDPDPSSGPWKSRPKTELAASGFARTFRRPV